MIEFGVLGPLLVRRNGQPVDMTATMLKRLQALLLVYGGEPVHLDTLADVLWCGDPPPSARKSLHVYAHRLRRALGDDERLTFGSGGYALKVASDELDLHLFQRLVNDANASNDPETAYSLLSQALALWRGDAYADISDLEPVNTERQRLAEHRRSAFEARVTAGLEIGRDDGLVAELRSAVTASPYRERLRGQLMLALYRAGRQAEALEVYRETHDVLANELGLEPATDLQQLHQQILRRDPALAGSGSLVQLAASTVPRLLPHDIADFTGRRADLDWLDGISDGSCGHPVLITAVEGTAGVGKTALAVHWAHQAAHRFPDGQLYVNLRGYDHVAPMRPVDALTSLLRCLAVPPDQLPINIDDASALYRSLVHGKRMLIVLDNVRSPEQVRPLLPGDTTSLVVVTSRDRLSGLIARDGVKRLILGALTEDESAELLRRIIGSERVSAEPGAVGDLIQLCASLPLALRIAAVHLLDRPDLALVTYVDSLRRHSSLIDAFTVDGDEHYAVRAVLDRSFDVLPTSAQQVFTLLGAIPGPEFTDEAIAALADIPLRDAIANLNTLAGAHVIERHIPGRYTFHDLVREYSRARLATSDLSASTALARLLGYLRRGAAKASSFITTTGPVLSDAAEAITPALTSAAEAMSWLEAERANLVAAVSAAAAAGRPDLAGGIATPLWQFFHFAGHTTDWINTFECALAAVDGLADERTRCQLLNALGNAYIKAGRYDQAISAHRETVATLERLGDNVGAARSRRNLAISFERQGRYDDAINELSAALTTFQAHGERLMGAMILGSGLTGIQNHTGQSEKARDGLLEALDIVREVGTPSEQVIILSNLGETYQLLGEPSTALSYLADALEVARKVGDLHSEALALAASADAHRALGNFDRAIELRLLAHELICKAGMRGDECESLNQLAGTYALAQQPDLAAVTYQDALILARELGESHQEARALVGIGMLTRDSDPEAARGYLNAALTLFEPISAAEAEEVRASLDGLR